MSDHSSRIDYAHSEMSFKGNLPSEYEQITPFHIVASGEKERIMLPITSLIKDRLCALKYVFSKATYQPVLSMSESHHFTV